MLYEFGQPITFVRYSIGSPPIQNRFQYSSLSPLSVKILALNSFHGGSHRAFLQGWIAHSRHQFDLRTMSGHHWKWRMRHSALHLANELAKETSFGNYDLLFCTDMLNLAEFRGLAPPHLARLPAVVYFHENQLTYPVKQEEERDLHFAYTNFLTAHAAESVWFNSDFHRLEFLNALEEWLPKMPDGRGLKHLLPSIRKKSCVHYPGLTLPKEPPRPRANATKPLHLLWVSRWEHDKGPEIFFAALSLLKQRRVPFRLSLLGESYPQSPTIFDHARSQFSEEITHWGYLPDYSEYQRTLGDADIVVSTARHEFFGIAVLEAVASGCRPLVPHALAYPEVLPPDASFFHDNHPETIADRLEKYAESLSQSRAGDNMLRQGWYRFVARYGWESVSPQMDEAVTEIVDCHK